jgi:hypothetical protein
VVLVGLRRRFGLVHESSGRPGVVACGAPHSADLTLLPCPQSLG